MPFSRRRVTEGLIEKDEADWVGVLWLSLAPLSDSSSERAQPSSQQVTGNEKARFLLGTIAIKRSTAIQNRRHRAAVQESLCAALCWTRRGAAKRSNVIEHTSRLHGAYLQIGANMRALNRTASKMLQDTNSSNVDFLHTANEKYTDVKLSGWQIMEGNFLWWFLGYKVVLQYWIEKQEASVLLCYLL
ncbi:hypothetical protein Q8A73_011482 [Channa argus]|nr:hypothetical protein Q8A73_011482 [Channa argus]